MSVLHEEDLRDVLRESERQRLQERRLRLENQVLFEGLRLLVRPLGSEELFGCLFEALRKALPFEDAFVLDREAAGAPYLAVAATSPRLAGRRWRPGDLFGRILAGSSQACFDVSAVGEWQEHPDLLAAGVVSAVHAPLALGERTAMLVCVHSRRGAFSVEQAELLRRLGLLVAQALIIRETRDLERLQREGERKAMQSELELLSLVARHTDRPVIITDHMGRVEWVNDGFVRLTGYGFEEIRGKNPGQVMAGPLTDPDFPRRMREGMASRSSFTIEVLNYHKSGSIYWVRATFDPIEEGKETTRYIVVGDDITDRKQAQQALREAKEAAEAANQAKTQFLANMSHEVRTPLNAILGMIEVVAETELSAEQRGYLAAIQSSGRTLLQLITDLLDLTKIDTSQVDLERAEVVVVDLVEEVVDRFALKAREKGLELVCHVEAHVPHRIVSDRNRLRQVLGGLLDNAIKFTDSGEVVLRVARIEREGGELGLCFSVRDTGIGIAEAEQPKVFERFFQADVSIGRKHGGSGLGLSIAQRLVELLEGRIRLESRPGRGSTFSVELPLEGAAEPPPCPEIARACSADRPLLVVEASSSSREALLSTLRSWRLAAAAFARVAEAEEWMAGSPEPSSEPPRLALIGLGPAQAAGELAAVRALRRRWPKGRLKLLLLAPDPPALGDLPSELEVSAVVAKPLRRFLLLSGLTRALHLEERESRVSAAAAKAVPDGSGSRRILLVEDNRENQILGSLFLRKGGHRVDLAEHGAMAVERTRSSAYDLVLMDLDMPVMDGFEATERIRRRERREGLPRVPIVALTAHAVKGFRERCFACGMDDYLTKPIDRGSLLQKVAELFRRSGEEGAAERAEGAGDGRRTADSAAPEILYVAPDIADLVPEYLSSSRRSLEAVADLLERDDYPEIRSIAHNLKGTGGGYGFTEITRLGARMEQAARAADREAISGCRERLLHYLDTVAWQPGEALD